MEEFKEMGVPEQLYRISAKQQQVNFMILPVYQSTDNDGVAEPVMGVASATQMLDAQVFGGETAADATMGAVASDKKDEGTGATWKPYEQYACGAPQCSPIVWFPLVFTRWQVSVKDSVCVPLTWMSPEVRING